MSISNHGIAAGFTSEGTFTPDNLIGGDAHIVTEVVTISSGQNLTRGAVLGKVTSGGEYVLSLSAAGNGSETPDAILLRDTDATSGAVKAEVAMTGEFNIAALTIGTGHTAASIRDGLRAKGIFLRNNISGEAP
jgi:hypothetical protein